MMSKRSVGAGILSVAVFLALEFLRQDATHGPNARRLPEVVWLVSIAVLGVALAVGAWYVLRKQRREPRDN
jgi:cytochrome bd-type quinol oxidase subunit 2